MQMILQDNVLRDVSEKVNTIWELTRIAEKGGDELNYATYRIGKISDQILKEINQALQQGEASREVMHA